MQDTGWFKHKPPNFFRCQCLRRFLELAPEILYTCLVSLRRAFHEWVCLFFVRYLGFCIVRDILVLRDPTFSAKNKQTKKPASKKIGKGILNTCAKFQGLTLKNGVDIWTFVRLSAKITAWHRNYLVLVYNRFWALNSTLRTQFFDFLPETLYKHALEHLETAGPEKNGS